MLMWKETTPHTSSCVVIAYEYVAYSQRGNLKITFSTTKIITNFALELEEGTNRLDLLLLSLYFH